MMLICLVFPRRTFETSTAIDAAHPTRDGESATESEDTSEGRARLHWINNTDHEVQFQLSDKKNPVILPVFVLEPGKSDILELPHDATVVFEASTEEKAHKAKTVT